MPSDAHRHVETAVEEVAPLTEDDRDCLLEIREVLLRHGGLDRFGITLLHSHFPLGEDEVLIEETDISARVQTVRPVARQQLEGVDVLETNWRFGETIQPLLYCAKLCRTREERGKRYHDALHDPRPKK